MLTAEKTFEPAGALVSGLVRSDGDDGFGRRVKGIEGRPVKHQDCRHGVEHEDEQEPQQASGQDPGAGLEGSKKRAKARPQLLPATAVGHRDLHQLRACVVCPHAGESLWGAPHPQQAVIEAGRGQGGSNDFGHGGDADVAHRAL
jgi:hypothetical protein